jgi:hypothetical protein
VVDLNLPSLQVPLGMEHLAVLIEELQHPRATSDEANETLTITLRPQTRQKLDRLAATQPDSSTARVSAAEIAAAIVERFVTAAGA